MPATRKLVVLNSDQLSEGPAWWWTAKAMGPAKLPVHRQQTAKQLSSAPSKGKPVASAPAVSVSAVPQLAVQRCWGLGSPWSAPACAWHPNTPGLLAYTAGCYMVLLDTASKQQLHTFSARQEAPQLPLQCLAFKPDGQYAAAGEGCISGSASGSADLAALTPAITVWELNTGSVAWQQQHHKQGVTSVAFNHDGRLLLSSGAAYDVQLCIWDWQSSGTLLARVSTHCAVNAACFNHDMSALLAAGKDQLKMWTISTLKGVAANKTRPGSAAATTRLALTPKPLSLRDHKTSAFVAVKVMPAGMVAQAAAGPASTALDQPDCGMGDVYALTSDGSVVLFKAGSGARSPDASIALPVPAAYCLDVCPTMVAVGCASGIVRLVAARTLAVISSLPRPSLTFAAAQRCASGGGSHQSLQDAAHGPLVTGGGGSSSNKLGPSASPAISRLCKEGRTALAVPSSEDLFPAAIATAFNREGSCLAVWYSDHSLIIWNVSDARKVTRLRSFMAHAGPVWDTATLAAAAPSYCATVPSATVAAAAQQAAGKSASIPLVTCAADGTLRIWNINLVPPNGTDKPDGHSPCSRMGLVQIGSGKAGEGPPVNYARAVGTLRGVVVVQDVSAFEAEDGTHQHSSNPALQGHRPQLLQAAGDPSNGGALIAASSKLVGALPSHAAACELRCLCVSGDCRHLAVGDGQGNVRMYDVGTLALVMCKAAHEGPVMTLEFSTTSLGTAGFLASGGKDGVVHVFDVGDNCTLINTLDEHAAAVLAVRFSADGKRLFSISADNCLLMRDITDPNDCTTFTYQTIHAPIGTSTLPRQQPAPRVAARCRAACRSAGASTVPTSTAVHSAKGSNKPPGMVHDMLVDPHNRFLVVATEGWLRCLDLGSGQEWGVVDAASGTGGGFLRVCLDASGTLAFCACSNGSVAVYTLPTCPSATQPPAAGSMCTLGANSKPAVASFSGSPQGGALLAYSKGHAGPARCVRLLSAAGLYGLVSIGEDGCIIQYDIPPSVIAHLTSSIGSGNASCAHNNVPAGLGQPYTNTSTRPLQPGASDVTATAGRLAVEPAGRPMSAGKSKLPSGPSPVKAGKGGMEVATPGSPQPCTLSAMWADPEQRALLSQTLVRVAQGQPLVSPDKLPRWAAARLNKPAPVASAMIPDATKGTPTEQFMQCTAGDVSACHVRDQLSGCAQAAAHSAAGGLTSVQRGSDIAANLVLMQQGRDMAASGIARGLQTAEDTATPLAAVAQYRPLDQCAAHAHSRPQAEAAGAGASVGVGAAITGASVGAEAADTGASVGVGAGVGLSAGVWGEGFDLEEDDGLVLFDERSMEQLGELQDVLGKEPVEHTVPAEPHSTSLAATVGSMPVVTSSAAEQWGAVVEPSIGSAAHGDDENDALCPGSGAGFYDPTARFAAMGVAASPGTDVGLPVCRDLFRKHYGPYDQASSSNTPTLAWPAPKLLSNTPVQAKTPTAGPQGSAAGAGRPFGSPAVALAGDAAMAQAGDESGSRRLSLTAAVRKLATSLLAAGPAGEELVIQATMQQGQEAYNSHPNQLFAAAAAASGAAGGVARSRLAGPELSPGPVSANNSTTTLAAPAAASKAVGPNVVAMEMTAVGPGIEQGVSEQPQLPLARADAGADGLEANSALTPPQPTRLAAARLQNPRAGRMEDDLAKMRERLSQLQATFAAQQARNTPWKQRLQGHWRPSTCSNGTDEGAAAAVDGAGQSTGSTTTVAQPNATAGNVSAIPAATPVFSLTPMHVSNQQQQQPDGVLHGRQQEYAELQQEERRESLVLTSPRGQLCYALQDSPVQPLRARLLAAACSGEDSARSRDAQQQQQQHVAPTGAGVTATAAVATKVHANAAFNGEPSTPAVLRTNGKGLRFVANAADDDGGPTPTLVRGLHSHRVSNPDTDPESECQHEHSLAHSGSRAVAAPTAQQAHVGFAGQHTEEPWAGLSAGLGAVAVIGMQAPAAETPTTAGGGGDSAGGGKRSRVPVQLPMFARPPVRQPTPASGRFSSVMEAAQAMAAEQQYSPAPAASLVADDSRSIVVEGRVGSAGKAGMLAAGSPSKGGKVLTLAQAYDAVAQNKTALTPRQSGMILSHLPRPPVPDAGAVPAATAQHGQGQLGDKQSPLQLQAAMDQLAHAVDALQLCCGVANSPGGAASLPENESLRSALLKNMQRLQQLLSAGSGSDAA